MEDGMEHGRCGIVIAAAALIALAALFALPGNAADDSEADFTSSDGLYTCTVIDSTSNYVSIAVADSSTFAETDYTIPSTVSDGTTQYTVTQIAANGFEYCITLTSVTIPDTVTVIGDNAFTDCYYMTSVEIPDSVTTIGVQAFLRCYGLTSVAIPSSVTSIGYEAFYRCSGLESVAVPSATMGESVFDACGSITTVYMDPDAYSADLFPACATEPTRYNYSYTVTFDANGGILSGDSTAAACYSSAFSFGQTAYRSGYDFAGWNTAADGSGAYVTSGDAWTYFASSDSSETTLYAQWEVPGESDGDGIIIAVIAVIAAVAVILLAAAYNRSRKKQ